MATNVTLITPEQETQLLGALTSAIKDANGGTPVNEALAKQANATGFGPEFAQRMVEAFNASKTLKHIGSTAGEKRADSFELADPKEVIALMYSEDVPGVVKVSSTQTILDPSKVNFNTNPETELRKGGLEKAAHLVNQKDRPVYKMPIDMRIDKVTRSARDFIEKIALARDELRRETTALSDRANECAYNLAEEFCMTDAEPFSEVEYRVRGKYGNAFGKQAMDIVWGLKDFERYGEARCTVIADRPTVMGKEAAYSAADEFVQSLKELASKKMKVAEFTKKADLAERWIKANIANINKAAANVDIQDFSKQPTADQDAVRSGGRLGIAPNKSSTSGVVAAAGGGDGGTAGRRSRSAPDGDAVSGVLGKGLKSTFGPLTFEPTEIIDKLVSEEKPEVESPVTPQHESILRQIRVKMMLNDMISNDPVISAYPPEDTFAAYNEVAEMSPALSTEPLLMRALVARILQSGSRLESHEVSDLLKAEESRRKTRILGY